MTPLTIAFSAFVAAWIWTYIAEYAYKPRAVLNLDEAADLARAIFAGWTVILIISVALLVIA